jgi:hypothetical protein
VRVCVQVKVFAEVSGDHNPLHLDEAFAKTTKFGRCIAHGMLMSSMFGTMIAQRLPGAIYLGQTLAFKAPVFVGDVVTARCGDSCVCVLPLLLLRVLQFVLVVVLVRGALCVACSTRHSAHLRALPFALHAALRSPTSRRSARWRL